jgi:TolB protein
MRKRALLAAVTIAAAAGFASAAFAVPRGTLPESTVQALPTALPPPPQVFARGELRAPFALAMPPLLGQADVSNAVLEVAVHDYEQTDLLRVIDPELYTSVNLGAEGMSVEPRAWRPVGADVVVKGETTLRAGSLHLELRAFVLGAAAAGSGARAPATASPAPALRREYDVAASDLRWVVHEFDDELLRTLTGTPGSFGGRLAFTAAVGQGLKAVFAVRSDGTGLARVSTSAASGGAAIAPAYGPGGALFYAGQNDGGWSLFKVGQEAPLALSVQDVLAVAFTPDGSKMAVVAARDGASDIYVGRGDGTGLSMFATGGLNTHPAWGPTGQLAYVSTHEGNPQIYVDGRRVTRRGAFNMAPTWCNDPEGAKVVFMGRDGTTWDIFSVAPTGDPASVRRLTENHGSNTYPACSPDGRTVAFFSTQGGLFTMTSRGARLVPIASTYGESLRWEGD